MTVSNLDNRDEFTGDDLIVAFNTSFPFFASSDLVVIERTVATGALVLQTLTTDYTVAGGDGSTGTVTMLTAPATGVTLVILRVHSMAQATDLTVDDGLNSETLEDDLDKAALRTNDAFLSHRSRSIRAPDGDPESLVMVLPDATARASATLGFDASGNVTVTAQSITAVQVSTAMSPVILAATVAAARGLLDAAEEVLTTRGDIVFRDATGYERLVKGTSGQFLQIGANDPIWVSLAESDLPVFAPTGYISGLQLSPDAGGGDTANDLNVTAGVARDSGDNVGMQLASETTKKIDVAGGWASGDDASGMPDTLLATDTWFHVFLIGHPTSGAVDIGFDTDISATNLLDDANVITAGHTRFRRIGSFQTDGSSNIIAFSQRGDVFTLAVPVASFDTTNPGTSRVTATVDTPLGIVTEAIMTLKTDSSGAQANFHVLMTALDQTDTTPTSVLANLSADTANQDFDNASVIIKTNTSSQIGYRSSFSDAGVDISVATHGWVDTRGRDD